jgi:CubicO group peptidase (beta-lactamase class C family)
MPAFKGAARLHSAVSQGLDQVFPAAVLLVRWEGETVFQEAVGFLDPETRRIPTREDTRFDLASLTKLFTATACMRLVEAGRTTLDTPVSTVLPRFSGARIVGTTQEPLSRAMLPADPRYAGQFVALDRVTFRHLLTHTSGLAPWRALFQVAGQETPLPHRIPPELRRRRLEAVYGCELACPTGAHVLYSDLGFILLGEAVERLSGLPLEACLQQWVFAPLELPAITFNPLEKGVSPEEIAPTEVCGWRGRRLWGEVDDENAAALGGAAGHAGLFAAAAEVAGLGQVYLDRVKVRTGRGFLTPETAIEMTREAANLDGQRRGLAWVLQTGEGCSCGRLFSPASFGHTGFTGTSLWVDPERELVVTLLTNRVYYGRSNTSIQEFRPWLHDQVIQALR